VEAPVNGNTLTLGLVGALALAGAVGRRGSADQPYEQETPDYTLEGVIYDNPVAAFDAVALPFLDRDYWGFLGLDRDMYEEIPDKVVNKAVLDAWKSLGGRPKDRVFAWNSLYLQPGARGKGLGRATVARIEDMLRKDGVKAILLQASNLDELHSLPFWTRLGYKEWPGDYGYYNDRILWKRL
jgi:GNAT superfamily N-acetyltransferase